MVFFHGWASFVQKLLKVSLALRARYFGMAGMRVIDAGSAAVII